jgi:hypothetical protein
MALRHAWHDHIEAILAGRQRLQDVPDEHHGPVSHLLKGPIYQRADRLLTSANYQPQAIKDGLATTPETIRDMVQDEARRLWRYRSQNR